MVERKDWFNTTADMIKADEAHNLGLVNHVVEPDELMAKCIEIITKIASKSPQAVTKTMRCIQAYYMPGTDGMEVEINHFGSSFDTEEFKEGTTAFLEKRKPDFRK